jgi:ribonuclease R
MILANVAAAETLEKAKIPLIYRAHDEPSLEKMQALAKFLASIGMKLPKSGALRPTLFNRILKAVEGTIEHQSWSTRWCCAPRRRRNTPPRITGISA